MEARSADIQRPNTNWLRTTSRNFMAGIAGGVLAVAGIGPVHANSAGSTPVNHTSTQPESDGCQWANQDGRRQPPVNVSPVTVRVDGSCDPDPSAPIGIYPSAKQVGDPIDVVNTDDKLTVQCFVTNGEPIQDVRGDVSTEGGQHIASSPVWLRVKTPRGVTGEVSETWAGFPGVATLASLGIRECRR